MSNEVIIYVSTNIKKDGAEKSLVSIQKFIREHYGINTVTIIPKSGPIEELLSDADIPYYIQRFEGNVNYNRGVKLIRGCVKAAINIGAASKLKNKLLKDGFNVIGVHSNTITSEMGAYLAEFLSVPHIWHIREFGKLDFGFDFELGVKYIKSCAKKAACVVCNSKAVMDYYKDLLNIDNLTFVHNGVTVSAMGKRNWKDKTFRMILIGRLSEEKGQDIAIEACRILKDKNLTNFVLDFYGDGAAREKYDALIKKYGLSDQVRLMGYSNSIPVSSYHLGLMLSHHEAFGRVTVEYMMNALPVIGIASGGTTEIVENGKSGILFSDNNSHILAERIEELYLDRDKCIRFGENGLSRAKELFNEERYCNNIYALYKKHFNIGG